MSRKTSYPPRKSDIFLGQRIKAFRVRLDMSQMQLGRKVNDLNQQIDRYECGAFIPLAKIEELAEALGTRVQKKIIRRISTERKLQAEDGIDRSDSLIPLYSEAFPEVDEDAADEE
jgi:transcriptional regulator with XRE-family HTH domain